MRFLLLQVWSVVSGEFSDSGCSRGLSLFDTLRRFHGMGATTYRKRLTELADSEMAVDDGELLLDAYEKKLGDSGFPWRDGNPLGGLWWLIYAVWEFLQGVMSVEEIEAQNPASVEGLFQHRSSGGSYKRIGVTPNDKGQYAFNRYLHLLGHHCGLSSDDMMDIVDSYVWKTDVGNEVNTTGFWLHLRDGMMQKFGPLFNTWWEGALWQMPTTFMQELYIEYLEDYVGFDYDGGGFNPG